MLNEEKTFQNMEKELKNISSILKQSLAIQLYSQGASKDQIAQNLHLSKTTVVEMLKGIKKND